MVSLAVRKQQLLRLIATLEDVLIILRQDEKCEWTPELEALFLEAKDLVGAGFTQAELDELSRAMGRMLHPNEGRLCHYHPPEELSLEGLHGRENFSTFLRAAYEQALQLRVVAS